MASPDSEHRPRRRPPPRRPDQAASRSGSGREPPPPAAPEPDAEDEDEESGPLPNRFRPVAYGALALSVGVVVVSLAAGVSAGDLPWLAIAGVLILVGVMLRADRRRPRLGENR